MSTLQIVGRCNVPTNEATQLTALFCHECGFNPLPWMPRQFARLITEGFTVDLLEELISRTARAPRPSWAYLAAILDNCRFRGVHDLPGFLLMRRVEPWERELPL